MYRIGVTKDRPDYRVFIDLLYGKDRDVDTDGDSDIVNSRTWTWLHIADREGSGTFVDICASESDPSIFEVTSESQTLEEVAAIYLHQYCGSSISRDGRELERKEIEHLRRLHEDELRRARNAIWHQSSDERPYPNLPL